MTPPLPQDLEPLLAPIAGTHPGGVELRYDPIYDKIKEARREDDDVPQGDWQTARKTADWPAVMRLATDALATRSKDLQIAAWFTEAKLRREGLGGLRTGLVLMRELVERYWDHLYPPIEDGDVEVRAAPLEWVGMRLEMPVRQVSLTRDGHDYLRYRESRAIPTESEAAESETKGTQRTTALADGKLAPEVFEQSFAVTPKAFYKQLVADAESCLEEVATLDTVSKARFADAAPSYQKLRESVEEVMRIARQLLKRKLELDPDPVDATAPVSGADDAATLVGRVLDAAAGIPATVAALPGSRDDACARVAAAAKWLRANHPSDPAAYLMLRGLRWGELRASGPTPDPRLLAAPSTETRTRLKSLLLDAQWRELLEHAETVMAMPQGRGWLDLQRYVLTACDALGSDFHYVGTAVRSALRSLLVDVPTLPEMTLMDDTPTANVETRAWLREAGLTHAESSDESSERDVLLHVREPGALAAAEVRAGRPDRAIALLMQEIGREKTARSRFVLQTQLARTMVEAGHHAVAMPVLEELVRHVDEHKLEEWEEGELVAQPLALLYRCLEQVGDDAGLRQSLYLRICRLDPLAAIAFTTASSAG
jgi:type VI secretion system protein ImpA